uniref:PHD-type domain-containing protein n=1 Tax=Anopheles culicifacies TaxID=139723 RepID=A0A182M6H2_9DIPT
MGKVCFLCKSSEDNELLFGKFYSKWRLTVHYYCLLLSSNLVQRGSNDTVGIFGFLESDIRKENERTKKCRCYICKNMHANVSCCSKKCLRTFHTVCGIMNGCLSHYTDTYQSWCSAHVPLDPDSNPHSPEEPCSICYDEMGQYDVITSIKAPCCLNGWFHQRCLAQYAQSAGYFFKCPLCKNEDKFLSEVPLRGVFVPERDAAWELEPNAFQEQLLRPTTCDADVCKCEGGRNVDNRQWRLKACGSCGSTCRHLQCMEQQIGDSRVYVCQLCRPILGEHVPMPENANDSGDSSEDDTASTSSSTSLGTTLRPRPRKQFSRAGSGESGVDCSSSNETLGNVRRSRAVNTARRIVSDGSDSELSDASSIQIRRCIRQNTGKRVRRLLSDGSGNEKSSETGRSPIPPSSDEQSQVDVSERGEINSNPNEERKIKSSNPRRPRIDSSSDDFENPRSEIRNVNAPVRSTSPQRNIKPTSSIRAPSPGISGSSDDLESDKEAQNALSSSLKSTKHHSTQWNSKTNLRPSKCDDPSTSCALLKEAIKNTKTSQEATGSSRKRQRAKQINISIKQENEISKMSDTVPLGASKSPSGSVKDENASVSDTSVEKKGEARRTRQLIRRLSPNARSTSESSMESIRPKRARASKNYTVFFDERKRPENGENNTIDKSDTAPLNKRRRLSRESCNGKNQSSTTVRHKPPSISPPSTPSSLSSESSQPSVASNSNTGEKQNRQQQSMLQFISISSRKSAATSDSSDLSTEGTVSLSRWARFGSCNTINSTKNSSIDRKCATSKPTKRRRTHSPKKPNYQSCNEEQTETVATSSKALVPQRTPQKIGHKCRERVKEKAPTKAPTNQGGSGGGGGGGGGKVVLLSVPVRDAF